MTLVQLRYFVAIADAGFNITQAADNVHATQPGLSKQLKQLEDELGFLLFVRKGRSLEGLTPAGGQVLSHARKLLAEAANIRAYAANQRRDGHGQLLIATTHTQARFVLPAVIAHLHQAYPQLSIHLQPSADGDVLSQLARGEADLALISTAGDVPADGIAIPMFRWHRVVLLQRGHPLVIAGKRPTLADLAAHPLVSYESSIRPDSSLRRAFATRGLEPQLAMTARDADLIKTYVRAGIGVGLLAEMAFSAVHDNDLVALPAPETIPECIAWAVLPRERVLRDYTVELLVALAPQLDRHDLRRVLAGNLEASWPAAPTWAELSQAITN
jgi:LysR family transcriptional regulator, cys regulon transcriptional activator